MTPFGILRITVLVGVLGLSIGNSYAEGDPCAHVAEALNRATSVRELPIQHPAQCRAFDRVALVQFLATELGRQLTPQRLIAEERTLKAIGFIPESYQYAQCLVKTYITDTVAVYLPRTHEFILPRETGANRRVLVHEAVHALQDQHFNLRRFENDPSFISDRGLAAAALIEGDAMVHEAEFGVRFPNENDPVPTRPEHEEEHDCRLPESVDVLLNAPYDYGSIWVKKIKDTGGVAGVNQAFQKPPKTMHEIMHRGVPVPISALVAQCRQTDVRLGRKGGFAESVGALFVRVLIRPTYGPKAGLVAFGWRGDCLSFEPGASGYQVRWEIDWSDAARAERFFEEMKKILGQRFSVALASKVVRYRAISAQGAVIAGVVSGTRVELNIQVPEK